VNTRSVFTSAAQPSAAQLMCEHHHWNTLSYYLLHSSAQRSNAWRSKCH